MPFHSLTTESLAGLRSAINLKHMLGKLQLERYTSMPTELVPGQWFSIGDNLYVSTSAGSELVATKSGIIATAGAKISTGDLLSIEAVNGVLAVFPADILASGGTAAAIALNSALVGNSVAACTKRGCVVEIAGAVDGPAYAGVGGKIISKPLIENFQSVGYVSGSELIFNPGRLQGLPIVGVELVPLPTVRIGYDLTVAEGTDTNAILLNGHYFYVTRTGSNVRPLTVTVNFSGTLTYGSDWFKAGESPSSYTTASATVTFAIGASSAELPVKIRADALVEPDETLTATLAPAANIILIPGENSATITVLNDDFLPSVVTVVAAPAINEGNPAYEPPTILAFDTHKAFASAHAFTGPSATFISNNSAVPAVSTEAGLPAPAIEPYSGGYPKHGLWYKWTSGPVAGPVRLKVRYTGPYTNTPTIGVATSIEVFSSFGSGYGHNTDNRNATFNALDPLVYFWADPQTSYYFRIATGFGANQSSPTLGYVGFELESVGIPFFTVTRTNNLSSLLDAYYSITPSDFYVGSRSNRSAFTGWFTARFEPGETSVVVFGLTDANSIVEPNTTVTLTLIPGGSAYTVGSPGAATFTIVDDDVLPVDPLSATYLNYIPPIT
jgi:hypothetical protein